MAVAFFPLRADDAYIVARYAANIAAGRGMVFNEGEAINALTSPLHLGVLVLLQPLAGDFVTVYRVLCAVLVATVLVTCAWRTWGRSPAAAYFVTLTLACPFVVFWSVGGLETPILLCICTAIAFLSLHDERRNASAIVALAAVAVLVRYDAVLFVAPAASYALWRHRGDTAVRVAFAAGVMGVLIWFAFTFERFGDVLPTSFYVKAGRAPALDELGRGLLYVASFLCLTWIWTAATIGRRGGAPNAMVRMLWLGLAFTFAYALFASTKHMMYGYRLLVPYLPVLAVALLSKRTAPIPRAGPAVAVLLAWQAGLAAFVYFFSQNPSLALLVERTSEANERFEFSHFGARYTGTFLDTAPGQSEAIRRHWSGTGLASVRAPRLLVSTGGLLPYLMPEAYVFEQLVSYRHDCKAALEPLADYVQAIFPSDQSARFVEERMRLGRASIARFTFDADGLRNEPRTIVVEVWYRASDAPNSLPPKLRGACQ